MRIILSGFATVLVIVGAFAPIPGGTVILGAGTALLICSSEFAAQCIRTARTRFHWLNRGVTWVEDRVGARLGVIIRRTRPPSV